MENIVIKKVLPDEVIALQKFGRQTFKETFAAGNTDENLTKYLENRTRH